MTSCPSTRASSSAHFLRLRLRTCTRGVRARKRRVLQPPNPLRWGFVLGSRIRPGPLFSIRSWVRSRRFGVFLVPVGACLCTLPSPRPSIESSRLAGFPPALQIPGDSAASSALRIPPPPRPAAGAYLSSLSQLSGIVNAGSGISRGMFLGRFRRKRGQGLEPQVGADLPQKLLCRLVEGFELHARAPLDFPDDFA